MKYLCCLLLVACSLDEHQGEIDPRLQPYVDAFVYEAIQRGVNVDISHLTARIEPINASGRGYDGYYPVILINPESYDFYTSGKWVKGDSSYYGLENLVFHELGHAVLSRKHTNEYSIMSQGMSCFVYAKDMRLRTLLLNELFKIEQAREIPLNYENQDH